MTANRTLLRMKYARVVLLFAQKAGISLEDALDFFYHSEEYADVSTGLGDLHCMSDGYLAEDLVREREKWLNESRTDTGSGKRSVRNASKN